jgi:hypothetical protein
VSVLVTGVAVQGNSEDTVLIPEIVSLGEQDWIVLAFVSVLVTGVAVQDNSKHTVLIPEIVGLGEQDWIVLAFVPVLVIGIVVQDEQSLQLPGLVFSSTSLLQLNMIHYRSY